jgi:hypothetical protein
MFRKTIAVLLMFSIVLSSCGKKDKNKSNDFVRTTPVDSQSSSNPITIFTTTPVDSQSLQVFAEAMSAEAKKNFYSPPSKACLKVLRKSPTCRFRALRAFTPPDCRKVAKVCTKNDLNPSSFSEVASVVKASSFCSDAHTRCHESLQKGAVVLDCISEDLNCVEDLISLNNSIVPKRCSPEQEACFAVYGVPSKSNSSISLPFPKCTVNYLFEPAPDELEFTLQGLYSTQEQLEDALGYSLDADVDVRDAHGLFKMWQRARGKCYDALMMYYENVALYKILSKRASVIAEFLNTIFENGTKICISAVSALIAFFWNRFDAAFQPVEGRWLSYRISCIVTLSTLAVSNLVNWFCF